MADHEEAAGRIAASTKKIEKSTERVEDSADRRTELAADRTVFAAERTYAAWVRTGLFALASGVGVSQLLEHWVPSLLVAASQGVLLIFSAFCFLAGIWRHHHPGPPPPRPDARPLPLAVLVAFNLFLALLSLAVLIGLWTR